MCQSEIGAMRALLGSRPRAWWTEPRRRLDEIGSCWHAAHDGALPHKVPGNGYFVCGAQSDRASAFLEPQYGLVQNARSSADLG
jgi:hypothetical protein